MPLLRLVKAEHIADFGNAQVKFHQRCVHTARKVAAVIMNGGPNLVNGSPRESHIPAIPTAAAAFWHRYKEQKQSQRGAKSKESIVIAASAWGKG